MAEQKRSGVLKWVLIGCGGIVGLALLCTGGCFGLIYFGLKSMVEEVQPVGAAYLKAQPEIESELGALTKAEAKIVGSFVQKVNDGGAARVAFEIEGAKSSSRYTATVWFERAGGTWKAVGCQVVTSSGKPIKLGHEVEIKTDKSHWND